MNPSTSTRQIPRKFTLLRWMTVSCGLFAWIWTFHSAFSLLGIRMAKFAYLTWRVRRRRKSRSFYRIINARSPLGKSLFRVMAKLSFVCAMMGRFIDGIRGNEVMNLVALLKCFFGINKKLNGEIYVNLTSFYYF